MLMTESSGARKEAFQRIVLVYLWHQRLIVEGGNQSVDPYIEREDWNLRHKTGDCINFLTEEAGIPSGYIIINIKEHCRDPFHSNEKM